MSASDWQMPSDATQHFVSALADALHWQIIEQYWNTSKQQNNIWSILFEGCTNKIWKKIC